MTKLTREEAIRGAARVLVKVAVRLAQEDAEREAAERAHDLPTPDPGRSASSQVDTGR